MRSQAYREGSGKWDQRGEKVLGNDNTTEDNHNSSYYSLSSYPVPGTGLSLSVLQFLAGIIIPISWGQETDLGEVT